MCNSLDMKYSEGNKSLEFTLSGYSDEKSLELARDIIGMITKSGKLQSARKIKIPIKGLNRVIEKDEITEQVHNDIKKEPETHNNNVFDLNSKVEMPKEITPIDDSIPVFNNDNETFQTYYICKCGDRGKFAIKRSQIHVNCRNCGKRMRVRDAHMDGFPMKDDYGNSFIAGEFKRSDELKYGAAFY